MFEGESYLYELVKLLLGVSESGMFEMCPRPLPVSIDRRAFRRR